MSGLTAEGRALQWLKGHGSPGALRVDQIETEVWHHDDTDGCGCETFEVTLRWTGPDGRQFRRVEGDDLRDFWAWMVAR